MPTTLTHHLELLGVAVYTVGFFVVAFGLRALSRRGAPLPPPRPGQLVLAYTRGRKRAGWAIAYVANFIGCWLVTVVLDMPEHPWEWLFVTGLIAVVTVFCFVEVHRARALIDDERFVLRRSWAGPIDVAWDDIDRVRYNDTLYWLTFTTRSGRRFRVSRAIGNFGQLLIKVRQKIAGRRFVDSGTSNLIATELTKS